MTTIHNAFAVVTPGLEAVAGREMRALGLDGVTTDAGGVSFRGDDRALLAANLRLRVASRVLVRVAEFPAKNFAALERHAKQVDWRRFSGPALAFRVTCRKSRLYHSDAVAERLAKAAAAQLPDAKVGRARGEDAESDGQLFVVRMDHDVCTISADASGALLHRRGYRLATAKAPIRETIAAGCLLALGYDGSVPLIDPMCGAGTFPIEAAMIARRLAPGRSRAFACERWRGFDATAAALARADADTAERSSSGDGVPRVTASDRDAGAVTAAHENAARAGVAADIAFATRPLSALEAGSEPGFLLANPPYGARVKGGADIRNLYAQLGNVARKKLGGWRVALVVADAALAAQAKLPFEEVLAFSNGGIRVRLVATR